MLTEYDELPDGKRKFTKEADELFMGLYRDVIKLMPKPPTELTVGLSDELMKVHLSIPIPSEEMERLPSNVVIESVESKPNDDADLHSYPQVIHNESDKSQLDDDTLLEAKEGSIKK